jgi:hypothetical protein
MKGEKRNHFRPDYKEKRALVSNLTRLDSSLDVTADYIKFESNAYKHVNRKDSSSLNKMGTASVNPVEFRLLCLMQTQMPTLLSESETGLNST